ncbi:unnamed protein product, partial [Symbiodinium microadriaticum]
MILLGALHAAKETKYSLRVVPPKKAGTIWSLHCECSTLGRPERSNPPRCIGRWPDKLRIEWKVRTPVGAPILECQVQQCSQEVFSVWQDVALLEDVAVSESKNGKPSDREETWSAAVPNLKAATSYHFRVKACNTVGWCADFSDEEIFRTSEPPEPPVKLKLVSRQPAKVEVEFEFLDADGCPVSHIEPEFCLKPESTNITGVIPGESADGFSNILDAATWWWQTPQHFQLSLQARIRNTPQVATMSDARRLQPAVPVSHRSLWRADPQTGAVANTGSRRRAGHRVQRRGTWRARAAGLSTETDFRATWAHVGGRSHVRIEFRVPLNYGQEEHISEVRVEQAGMLVWTELPSQSLEFECLDKVDSYSTEPTAEDIDLGPFWNAELKLRAFAVVVRGLEPNCHYTLRLDVANEVGWSRFKSDPFSCHTVCRPHVPKLREGPHSVPYELRVSWDQRDPLGGAVLEWEAQICESSLFTLFSSWTAAKDFLILRQPTLHDMVCEDEELAINTTWEASFGCLKPAVEYVMRLRTGNIAGWSEWSEPLQAVTACPPSISRCSLVQVPANMPGSQPDWIVDILVDERGSRAFLCAVDFSCTLRDATFVDAKSTLSSSTVARHIINGSWRARFPGNLLPAGSQKVSVSATAANDAGWSASVRKSSEDTDGQTKTLSWDMPSSSTSPSALPAVAELGHSLKAFLAMMEEKLCDMASTMQASHQRMHNPWTTEQLQRLSHRAERIDLALETLR